MAGWQVEPVSESDPLSASVIMKVIVFIKRNGLTLFLLEVRRACFCYQTSAINICLETFLISNHSAKTKLYLWSFLSQPNSN